MPAQSVASLLDELFQKKAPHMKIDARDDGRVFVTGAKLSAPITAARAKSRLRIVAREHAA